MRRLIILAGLALAVLVAGCGGSHHTQRKHLTRYGVQAHSPQFGKPGPLQRTLNPTAAPTIEMFDTVTLSTVPANPRVLAGYTSGFWPTFFSLVRAYPHAKVVSIAINTGHHARCLDVEPGDAVPSQVVGWIRDDRAAGFRRPCVYSNLSEWQEINGYLRRAGVPRSAYFAWLADWVYHPGLAAGFDAQQWTEHAFGRNLDESTVSLAFAGLVKPKPVPVGPTREQIARWTRARDSSRRAYVARGCVVLAARDAWFSHRLHGPKAAKRRRALRATRRAYRQRQCAVFARRTRYFDRRLRG